MKQAAMYTLSNGKYAQAFIQVDIDGNPVTTTDLEARVAAIESMLNIVQNYNELPDSLEHTDEFFLVKHDVPGKQAGIYASNGNDWIRVVKFQNWS